MSLVERTLERTDHPAFILSCPRRPRWSGICGKDCVFVSSLTFARHSRPSCPCSDALLGGSVSTTTSWRPPLAPGVGTRWSDALRLSFALVCFRSEKSEKSPPISPLNPKPRCLWKFHPSFHSTWLRELTLCIAIYLPNSLYMRLLIAVSTD